MSCRHEEKYIIGFREYLAIKSRLMSVLTPDSHGNCGRYVITSLYYDDESNTALLEKLDGLPEHSKFRLRTYDFSKSVINLERKDKHGILTEKRSIRIEESNISLLGRQTFGAEDSLELELSARMMASRLRPAVTVRYIRDAFCYGLTDLRITFDTQIEAIRPELTALFDPMVGGVPVLDGGDVIMEIKYGEYLPGFVRKIAAPQGKQLSVSKYALCREKIIR